MGEFVKEMKNKLIAELPAPSCRGIRQLCGGAGSFQVFKKVTDGEVRMQCSNGEHWLCWNECILVTGCNAASIEE